MQENNFSQTISPRFDGYFDEYDIDFSKHLSEHFIIAKKGTYKYEFIAQACNELIFKDGIKTIDEIKQHIKSKQNSNNENYLKYNIIDDLKASKKSFQIIEKEDKKAFEILENEEIAGGFSISSKDEESIYFANDINVNQEIINKIEVVITGYDELSDSFYFDSNEASFEYKYSIKTNELRACFITSLNKTMAQNLIKTFSFTTTKQTRKKIEIFINNNLTFSAILFA